MVLHVFPDRPGNKMPRLTKPDGTAYLAQPITPGDAPVSTSEVAAELVESSQTTHVRTLNELDENPPVSTREVAAEPDSTQVREVAQEDLPCVEAAEEFLMLLTNSRTTAPD